MYLKWFNKKHQRVLADYYRFAAVRNKVMARIRAKVEDNCPQTNDNRL